jgi:hypothetical protein
MEKSLFFGFNAVAGLLNLQYFFSPDRSENPLLVFSSPIKIATDSRK